MLFYISIKNHSILFILNSQYIILHDSGNMLALVDDGKQPQRITLRDSLTIFINYRYGIAFLFPSFILYFLTLVLYSLSSFALIDTCAPVDQRPSPSSSPLFFTSPLSSSASLLCHSSSNYASFFLSRWLVFVLHFCASNLHPFFPPSSTSRFSTTPRSPSFLGFLPSWLPSFFPYFFPWLPSFLASILCWFLYFLSSYISPFHISYLSSSFGSCFPTFLLSLLDFLPSFFLGFLSFLLGFLPFFSSILSFFLSFFLSFLVSFLSFPYPFLLDFLTFFLLSIFSYFLGYCIHKRNDILYLPPSLQQDMIEL